MELQHWQSQFEAWLRENHLGQDAAHDLFHFRRVWMTSQQLSTDVTVDWLVVLTACYFHDLISLPKTILTVIVRLYWLHKKPAAC